MWSLLVWWFAIPTAVVSMVTIGAWATVRHYTTRTTTAAAVVDEPRSRTPPEESRGRAFL